jgi:aspartate carbamoyltransferase catalytic subunit
MGGRTVDVVETRFTQAMSVPESVEDTLRVVSGMVDLVVCRVTSPLRVLVNASLPVCPIINAGDALEHPTQALIDVFAIEQEFGSLSDLHIGICGDLGSRCVTSLLRLLERRSPASLKLMAPPTRSTHVELDGPLSVRTTESEALELEDLDVLYLAGLPAKSRLGTLSRSERSSYSLHPGNIERLPHSCIVLSPLPRIDEVASQLTADSRVRIFEQSDMGVTVRRRVLELMDSQH